MSGPQEQLPADMMLAGKYQVIRPLGAGGMGTVYQALHVDIGRTVAVKLLAPAFAHAPEALARFRREARAAALIGHPAITDVLDFGETESGTPFIVMEMLRGETLHDVLRRARTLPPRRAVTLALDLLDALAAAHAAGIIHRDLKPPNVFLATHPVPMTKLLDFGISKFQHSGDVPLTQEGVALGTPSYMAPEQIRGEEVVPATDLYAVGAILYRALTGEVPFGGTNEAAIMVRAITEPVRPVRQLRADVPEPLAAFVERLLSKEPMDRAPSAAAAREELSRLARTLPLDGDAEGDVTPYGLERGSSEETPALPPLAILPPLEPVPSGNTTTVLRAEAAPVMTQELVSPPARRMDSAPTRMERSGAGRDTVRTSEPGRRATLVGTMAAVGGLVVAGLAVAIPLLSPRTPPRETPIAAPVVEVGEQGTALTEPRPAAMQGGASPSEPLAGANSGAVSAAQGGTSPAAPLAGAPSGASPAQGGTSPAAPLAGANPGASPAAPDLVSLTLTATPASARWVSSTLPLDCNPCTVRQPRGTRLDVELRAAGHVSQAHVLVFDQPREERHSLQARVSAPAVAPAKPSRGAPGGRLTIDRENPFDN